MLGTTSLVAGQPRLETGGAIALVVLGVLTAGLGMFVGVGHRWAMVVALVVFGGLFAVQAFGATGGSPAPAAITLAVVLLPLVLAMRATREADTPDDRKPTG